MIRGKIEEEKKRQIWHKNKLKSNVEGRDWKKVKLGKG